MTAENNPHYTFTEKDALMQACLVVDGHQGLEEDMHLLDVLEELNRPIDDKIAEAAMLSPTIPKGIGYIATQLGSQIARNLGFARIPRSH